MAKRGNGALFLGLVTVAGIAGIAYAVSSSSKASGDEGGGGGGGGGGGTPTLDISPAGGAGFGFTPTRKVAGRDSLMPEDLALYVPTIKRVVPGEVSYPKSPVEVSYPKSPVEVSYPKSPVEVSYPKAPRDLLAQRRVGFRSNPAPRDVVLLSGTKKQTGVVRWGLPNGVAASIKNTSLVAIPNFLVTLEVFSNGQPLPNVAGRPQVNAGALMTLSPGQTVGYALGGFTVLQDDPPGNITARVQVYGDNLTPNSLPGWVWVPGNPGGNFRFVSGTLGTIVTPEPAVSIIGADFSLV